MLLREILSDLTWIKTASCRTDTQLDPIQTTPIIDTAEFSARELPRSRSRPALGAEGELIYPCSISQR